VKKTELFQSKQALAANTRTSGSRSISPGGSLKKKAPVVLQTIDRIGSRSITDKDLKAVHTFPKMGQCFHPLLKEIKQLSLGQVMTSLI